MKILPMFLVNEIISYLTFCNLCNKYNIIQNIKCDICLKNICGICYINYPKNYIKYPHLDICAYSCIKCYNKQNYT